MIVTLKDATSGKELIRYPSHFKPSHWTIQTMREQYGIVMTVEQVH